MKMKLVLTRAIDCYSWSRHCDLSLINDLDWNSIYLFIQTVSAVQCFFLAMAMYPDVQRKAQAEIDAVIGNERLPEFSDRHTLPYMNALVKESMRWQSIIPLGTQISRSECRPRHRY